MTEPALEVRGFSFSREGKGILRNLSFSVAAGERVALVGPNGAGKTTLLKCLLRIHRGALGEVRVFGRPLDAYEQIDLARRLAYVPQAEGRSAPYTVRDVVEMARYPHLGPLAPARPEDAAAVDGALEETGLGPLAGRFLDTLSGGERQKALLAAAMAQQADVLLLDEPTAFLDPSQQADMLAVLGRVHRDRGATIVSVTHDLNEALAHSDRVLALREGELVFDGSTASLAQVDVLRRIYDHGFAVGAHPRTGRPVLFSE
jgi:iron complex transport system ATP-binding protein